MGVDDYVSAETGVLAAATAAAVSPKARDLIRQGAVYGLAGVLKAGDVTIAAARGAVRGAKEGAREPARFPGPSSRPAARRASTDGGRMPATATRRRTSASRRKPAAAGRKA